MNKVIAKKHSAGLTVGKIIFLVLLGLLFLFLLGVWLWLNVYTPSLGGTLDFSPDLGDWPFEVGMFVEEGMEGESRADGSGLSERVSLERRQGDNYKFLIVGRDEGGLLTDTVMLLHFNIKDAKISLLSIPRDSWINNSLYTGRINAAVAQGFNAARRQGKNRDEAFADGVTFLRHVISFTFGLPTDGYISVNLAGFKALVDAVGGVEFDVPQNMRYSDPYQNLHINLQAGVQTLDGDKAEQLVRFRAGYADQDIGRIRTQHKFLAALARKMIKFDIQQIRRISDAAAANVATNLSAANLVWFAAKLPEVGLENIILHTLPGEPAVTSGGASVWSLYRAESIQIINEHYNPHTEDIPEANFNIFELRRTYTHQIDISGVTMAGLLGD